MRSQEHKAEKLQSKQKYISSNFFQGIQVEKSSSSDPELIKRIAVPSGW